MAIREGNKTVSQESNRRINNPERNVLFVNLRKNIKTRIRGIGRYKVIKKNQLQWDWTAVFDTLSRRAERIKLRVQVYRGLC